MARPPGALPDEISGSAFSVRSAVDAGVSRQRLRHPSLVAPTRGLRVQLPTTTLLERAQAWALVLSPPWAYSRQTAAGLLGLPLPNAWAKHQTLSVIRPTGCAPVRRPGVHGHRGLELRKVLLVHGLPATDLIDTWCDLASTLELTDLVIAGDAVLNRIGVDHEAVLAAIALRRRHRGARLLAAALPLLRVGSGSPMETRARLAFREGGLPEPELNADVLDPEGNWVARADFVWKDARVIVEYEGDEHRTDRRRWQTEIARLRLLEDLGWKVIRITALDLSTPQRAAAMVERVRNALLERCG